MTFNILQWNINGYYNNYSEIDCLIKDHNPQIICLQETHIIYNLNPYTPKQFTGYFHNFQHNTTVKQGSGILFTKVFLIKFYKYLQVFL